MNYLLKRLLLAPAVLLLIALATFAMVRSAKGGPFDAEREMAPAVKAAMAERMGFDRPLPVQFVRTLAGVADGSLPTLSPGQDVGEVIRPKLGVSLVLGGAALLLAVIAGLGLALAGAMRPGSWLDRLTASAAMAAIAVPAFVIGPVLALVFGLRLGWLPSLGWGDLIHLLLPMATLAAAPAARIARLARSSLADAAHADHVRTARAKGVGAWTVLVRHQLRPALVPVVAFLGTASAYLLTGSVVVEQVFQIPGLGSEMVQAAFNRDHNLVMALTLVFGLLVVLCNLAADLAVAAVDPRVRLS
jgi:oligopeptide transport system permease protein